MTFVPIAIALVALGQLPLSTEVELPTGEKAILATDLLSYEPSRQLLTAKGNTVLKSGQVLLRADEITFDQSQNVASAKGHVMFVSGLFAAVADAITVDINSFEATVEGGLFMQKKNVAPEVLLAAKTPQELKDAGDTVVAITGKGIKRKSPQEFVVEGLVFTPCDCDPKQPSWRVEAQSAAVEIGEKAILTWPVVYVYQVPVFALPWLYLPLSDRRTGLLVPQPKFGGLNKFAINQPIFVTLGRSYDMTLSPGYYFGTPTDKVTQPDGTVTQVPKVYGIEGPRLFSEFRYVPSADTSGRATFGLVYDLRDKRDPITAGRIENVTRGLRWESSLQHTQDLGAGFFDRVDASFVSDGNIVRDFTADVLAVQEGYLRSAATAYHRTDNTFVGLDAIVRQDLRYGYNFFTTTLDANGNQVRGPATMQRLPALTFALPERTLFGPVFAGASASVVRIAPLLSSTGDEGANGVFNPYSPEIRAAGLPVEDAGQGNGVFDPGEREGRIRAQINPRLAAEFGLGRFAKFSPYASYREAVYFGEQTRQVLHRGYPVLGAQLESEIAKTFGEGEGALRHSIAPSAEVRWVPRVFGSAATIRPYDEIDSAVGSSDGLLQATAQISQRLLKREGNAGREVVRLDVGQNFDLQRNVPGDTFARFNTLAGTFGAGAIVRYNFSEPVPADRLTQLSANLRIDNGKGTFLYGQYDNLPEGGSERMRAGIDELIGRPYVPPPPPPDKTEPLPRTRAEQLVAGARLQFTFGLGLRYEALTQRRPVPDAPPLPDTGLPPTSLQFLQHVVGLSYGPACDCWRFELTAIIRPGTAIPELGGNLTLARFGTLGG